MKFLSLILLSGILAFQPLFISAKAHRIRWIADVRKWNLKGDETFRQSAAAGMQSFMADNELFEAYKNRPEELRYMAKATGMKNWMLDAGVLLFDGSDKPETLKYLEKLAEFGGKAGAGFLVFHAEKRDAYPAGKAKLSKLALAMDAVARIASKHKIRILMENSMHSICQTSDELEFTLMQCKEKNTGILLDLAFMAQAGSNPQEVILKLGKKIQAIRFNDLTRPVKGFAGPNDRNYRLEIPGKGNALSYPEILEALNKAKFKGIGILGNASPDDKSNPLQSVQAGKEWLTKAGFSF
jgi:sugar phosphate isomerase/epimerase